MHKLLKALAMPREVDKLGTISLPSVLAQLHDLSLLAPPPPPPPLPPVPLRQRPSPRSVLKQGWAVLKQGWALGWALLSPRGHRPQGWRGRQARRSTWRRSSRGWRGCVRAREGLEREPGARAGGAVVVVHGVAWHGVHNRCALWRAHAIGVPCGGRMQSVCPVEGACNRFALWRAHAIGLPCGGRMAAT
jgi:hypothetical protein